MNLNIDKSLDLPFFHLVCLTFFTVLTKLILGKSFSFIEFSSKDLSTALLVLLDFSLFLLIFLIYGIIYVFLKTLVQNRSDT